MPGIQLQQDIAERKEKTVIFVGAGASVAVGGLATVGLLPAILDWLNVNRNGDAEVSPAEADELAAFLAEHFRLYPEAPPAAVNEYPSLATVLSYLDMALDRQDSLGVNWGYERIGKIRRIFDKLLRIIVSDRPNLRADWRNLMRKLAEIGMESDPYPTIITTNYDLLLDETLIGDPLFGSMGRKGMIDYGFAPTEQQFSHSVRAGSLLKLHGSLNWRFCPNCHHMTVFRRADWGHWRGRSPVDTPVSTENMASIEGKLCRHCRGRTRSLIISPSYFKSLRNVHLASIWARAEQELRRATRVVFVGYSLPDDDLEVMYLLKRSLARLPAQQITVVDVGDEHCPVCLRYRAVLGNVQWFGLGLETWLAA